MLREFAVPKLLCKYFSTEPALGCWTLSMFSISSMYPFAYRFWQQMLDKNALNQCLGWGSANRPSLQPWSSPRTKMNQVPWRDSIWFKSAFSCIVHSCSRELLHVMCLVNVMIFSVSWLPKSASFKRRWTSTWQIATVHNCCTYSHVDVHYSVFSV